MVVEQGADGVVEAVVVGGGVVVDGGHPQGRVADSGGDGVGVAGVRGAVGPGVGHGVEGQVAGADFEDAGVRVGVEVGCGGFHGGHLPVVVVGEAARGGVRSGGCSRARWSAGFCRGCETWLGDAVLLVLDAAGGLVEEVEGELEFVVHGVFSVRCGEWCAGRRWGAVNRLRVGGQPRRVRAERSRVFGPRSPARSALASWHRAEKVTRPAQLGAGVG